MHGIDPYDPSDPTYECPECGTRSTDDRLCTSCETDRRNITVARE